MNDSASTPEIAAPSVEEIAALLAPLPIFARLDAASLRAVAERCVIKEFRTGDTIMEEGRMSTFADMILAGEVDVFVNTPAGQVNVATVGVPHIVGELGALAAMPRSATIIARSDLRVLRLERGSLMGLILEHAAIGVAMIAELGQRIHRMNRSLAYLSYAANALGRDEYDPEMLAELTRQPGELANFARAFANMAAELEAKARRRDEMQAAAAIQNSILPRPLAREGALAVIDLHAEMHPAREIGGDFYDYFAVEGNRLAITVADVSGKGIPAALFMAVSRTVLRGGERGEDMAAHMEDANRLLATENAAAMFVTAFHGVLDLATGALRYCNAGHNPPYLLRAAGGRETLKATGIPFGVDGDMPYRIAERRLAPGDALFLFSDGITEAFNPEAEEFGTARLEAALEAARGEDAAALVARVLAATREFAAGAEQSDDITALALVWRG
ncbi:MAG TPA: SpoIIE family protein phosphatase [Stellaceae bacterium]|jgi:serine phosphatase RsbU (regulator of sigma subunit)|nr:SpoIIE family protein phosphatase [Stellaceae bacterium]